MARILVADDHEDTRDLLATMLTKAGHEVLLAVDGIDAQAQYRKQRPDVAILDIFMPGMDGIETVMELRAEFPDARLIAISAGWRPRALPATEGTPDVLQHARVLGADFAIKKPIEPAELIAIVNAALALPR